MRSVEGGVDDFGATPQNPASCFPPSLPQLSLSLWHLLDKQNEGSFTPGTFPPSGKVTSIPTFAYQIQCYAVVQQMVNR
jgi:hypothetical protein